MTDTTLSSVSHEDIVDAIRAATNEVFTTMLNMEIGAQEVLPPPPPAAVPASGIISLIGLAGPWCGTGSLACTSECACKLSSQFLMGEYATVNEDVMDAVAEITNMIIGNVKNSIEQKVGPMGLSTPTVIYGSNFQTRSARTHEWTRMRFASGPHDLYVQMCLAPAGAPNAGSRPGFQFPQMLG